ncbi:hypothetical protein [Streptomyces hygroscopicus]|uniref:hypothetical protein n=1 Tax=Streptomyces hygroscopicus TaxID=1912 RepID=UPI0036CAE1FA
MIKESVGVAHSGPEFANSFPTPSARFTCRPGTRAGSSWSATPRTCASNLSGRGASLAITGTWLLAQALHKHQGDLETAFDEYETNQRPYATRAQDSAGPGGDLIMPATQQALDARNERLRAMPRG